MRNDNQNFPTGEQVDFVIVGSARGVIARELSTASHSVVVLEQGPYLKPGDFRHDELMYKNYGELTWGAHQGHIPSRMAIPITVG